MPTGQLTARILLLILTDSVKRLVGHHKGILPASLQIWQILQATVRTVHVYLISPNCEKLPEHHNLRVLLQQVVTMSSRERFQLPA